MCVGGGGGGGGWGVRWLSGRAGREGQGEGEVRAWGLYAQGDKGWGVAWGCRRPGWGWALASLT